MRAIKKHAPLVTVVMSCYNSSATIGRAIDSVYNQLYKNIELIVVDDASTDQTLEIVQKYKDKWHASSPGSDRRRTLRVISGKRNYGTYVCRNYAIQKSTGEYITFHDSDDVANPFYVIKLVNQLVRNKHAKISVCLTNGRVGKKGKPVICATSTCFHRNLIKYLGYFDSVRFGADSEFRKRCEARFGLESVSILNEKL